MSCCSAVVERDAAASRVTQLEREIGSLKNELSQVCIGICYTCDRSAVEPVSKALM